MDLKRFRIYVPDTRVWKGWGYIIDPLARRIEVDPPYKYMVIVDNTFMFEASTEELGESPDWDYNNPRCTVLDFGGFWTKTIQLNCLFQKNPGDSFHSVELYYGDLFIGEFDCTGMEECRINRTFEMTESGIGRIALPAAVGIAAIGGLYIKNPELIRRTAEGIISTARRGVSWVRSVRRGR